jgi:transcription initiation factor TFIID subunit TAF12
MPRDRQTNTCRKRDRQIHAERKTILYQLVGLSYYR